MMTKLSNVMALILLICSVSLPLSTALQHSVTKEQQAEYLRQLGAFHKSKNSKGAKAKGRKLEESKARSLRTGSDRLWLRHYHGLTDEPEQADGSTTRFVTNSEIFNVSINTFSQDFVKPYASATELEEDLTAIMLMFADSVISGNFGGFFIAHPEVPEAGPIDTVTGGEDPPSAGGATDFETNNQEEGVDEADTVKSDGRYVYAVYGDTIVVWEALTGASVTNVTLPPVVHGRPSDPVEEPGVDLPFLGQPEFYISRPYIRGLLLSGSRLTVIVEGYGGPIVNDLDFTPVFYNTMATRVIVYSTESLSTTGELVQVHQRDLDGSYRDARSIGDVVHLVSTSGFDVYTTIVQGLARWNPRFIDLEESVYIQEAKTIAARDLVPAFVSGVISAISNEDGSLPNVARAGLWQEVLSNHSSVERGVYVDGPVVNTYTQVASFNVSDDGEELGISLSGAFMPSSWGYTYTTPDMLIFAAQGWNWIESMNGAGQTTYLLGFSINGTTTTPTAIGSTPGFLLNQYSLDIFDGHLRVATSIQSFWTVSEETNNEDFFFPIWRQITQNQVIVLKIPGLTDDGEAGLFEETGRIPDLGKEFELFTAVRFFDKVAYAVTFQRTDPFYVLNLTDPTNPMELGELSITGFSSYLHSVNRDNTMLVAVGQEADANGRVLGAQVTLFDARDPTNPRDVQRYQIENDPNAWSSSSVEWDYKAFRWLSLGDSVGLVILPLYVRTWRNRNENFDGFLVLDVSPSGISQRFNITHAQGEDFFGCYYWASLTQRSLVFNGNVTTLKGHSVLSTDLDTGTTTWELELMKPVNRNECVYW